jgi:hypothetical protein
MEPDDTPESRPRQPRIDHTPPPSDAELSRIARGAVHQPADPRIDKQLARMGLTESVEATQPQAGQSRGRGTTADPELDRLRAELRRTQMIVWVLVAIAVFLAVLVTVLLVS